MIRNLISVLLLLGFALAAGWLADRPGSLHLVWLDYEIRTSVTFLLVLLCLTILIAWFALRILSGIVRLPQKVSQKRQLSSQQTGVDALGEAFIALGEKNFSEAQRHIKRAERNLHNPTLPRLLQLQLMRQKGDEKKVEQQLQLLESSEETKPIALRGFLENAWQAGDFDTATHYAEALLKIKPKDRYSLTTAIALFAMKERWQETEKLIQKALRCRAIDKAESQKLYANLYSLQADKIRDPQRRDTVMTLYRAALRHLPAYTPATLGLIDLYKTSGKERSAIQLVRTAWKHTPHPRIADAFLALHENLSKDKKLQKMRDLAKLNPDASESHLAVARAAIESGTFSIARNHLKAALGMQKTVTACKLMAELEEAENQDENAAKNWLEQAATAIDDPSWQCEDCGHIHKNWHAHCANCHHFATLAWQPPMPPALPVTPKSLQSR